jgi:predicted RNA-binding Zn ribbon-like protein
VELLCLDFLNSDVTDYLGSGRRTDRLRDPGWVAAFAARWGLAEAGAPGRAALGELAALRGAMWHVVDAELEGREPAAADLDVVNDALAGSSPHRRLVRDGRGYRLDAVAPRRDWAWATAEIAASFADLLANRDLHRLKVCGNEACRWAFYDESKNRTRRWCGDTCGNLIKVRRFRDARSR